MKKNRGKIIIICATIFLALYFLYPTYQDYSFTKKLQTLSGEDSVRFVEENEKEIREARAKRIKLGLDLQGGMRVVLEADVPKLLEELANNKDEVFYNIFNQVKDEANRTEKDVVELLKQHFTERQIRINRYYGTVRESDEEVIDKLRGLTTENVDRAMEIVRNRVDQYGVSEPSIQKQGARRIIVELPGVTKEAEVRQLLQGTALLEFKLLIDPEISGKVYEAIDKLLAGKPLDDTSKVDTSQLHEEGLTPEERERKEHPFFSIARPNQTETQGWAGDLLTAEEDKAKVMEILSRPDVKKLIPPDMSFVWSAKPLPQLIEGKRYFRLYAVKSQAELTGGVITKARHTIDPLYNRPIVEMEMNSEGAREWARITGANVGKQIAIILDNACYSAPVVRQKISGGRSQIEGMDNLEEARLLEIVLKAGQLPTPVRIIQQTSVGPSLGVDSINKGLFSAILAFALTVIFMILYYRTGGTIADLALLLNLLFILGVLAGFRGTLTLPGIAGIILTMAVAVDANVLIFERIREEATTGKTLSASIDLGYSRAFTAIFDANLTTFITGIILYQFGSGPIQGFALTLMIGIAASMFSAIVITKVIFHIMVERGYRVNFG